MKYLIVEDEDPAAVRLEKLIGTVAPDLTLLTRLVSVKSAISWFNSNHHPDLAFMDIKLADGNSFEIFKSVHPICPVIFTTAYDQYAIAAFKVNSIDYLLKPVKTEELKAAISRFRERKVDNTNKSIDIDRLLQAISNKKEHQKRLLIRYGDTIKAIDVSDVAYFFTENKIHYLNTFNGKIHAIDLTLDQLEEICDPEQFFRINRQFIVNAKAIVKMISYSKSRVKLILHPETNFDTIVSTERSPNFKNWLTGSSRQF